MNSWRSDIVIDDIVHNDLMFYVKSDYGGKKIKKWPFYHFIKMWVGGDCDQARDLWIDWLVSEFNKYCIEVKSKGGMYQGSVHRYALNYIDENKHKYWLDPSLISKMSMKQGAALLVDRRIELIRSIMNKGYLVDLADPIYAVRKSNLYVLKGGHHRAAIMHVLGHNNLPGVMIYSKPLWEFRKWLVKIKKLLG